MFRAFLSWRYLRRLPTNWIGIVGIFVAVSALIVILSVMTGFLAQSRKTLRGSLSDIVITPRMQDLPEPDALLELVRGIEGVAGAAAHLSWFGLMSQEGTGADALWANSQFGQHVGVKLVGIDLEDEREATGFQNSLERPQRFGAQVEDLEDPFGSIPERSYGRPRKGVIVGDQLFRVHGLRRGSEIEILAAVPDATSGEWLPCNRKFAVAGTFRSGESEMDLERIYLERSELADFLGGRSYNEVLVRLHGYERDAPAVHRRIEEALAAYVAGAEGGFEVKTWEEVRRDLLGAIENERILMAVMLSLVLLVAGFTIFAILSMLVSEKRRDIGVLTALGATPRGVMAVFVLIAFWDALLGGTLGAVAGCYVALNIDGIERWVSDATADLTLFGRSLHVEIFDRSVYLFDHIPSIVEPWRVAVIVFGAFLCALLFSAIPALKAAHLDPLNALRYE